MEGLAERQQIVFDKFDWIEGVCRRLPVGWALYWNSQNWLYRPEYEVRESAEYTASLKEFEAALKERRRGKRLVVIVAAGGVLYQFV